MFTILKKLRIRSNPLQFLKRRKRKVEPFHLAYYAHLQLERYRGCGDDALLQQALQSAKLATQDLHESDQYFSDVLYCCRVVLAAQYERFGGTGDLEEAIRVTRNTIEATPADSPNLAGRLNSLGIQLVRRFERLGTLDDLEEAIRVAR